MKLYENIIIGNFLYALGYAIRARCDKGCVPSVINLLQQTPADPLLGDVLLAFPGVVRLIEFKAEGNRSPKERARHRSLGQMMVANPDLEPVSRQVHWYVETAPCEHSVVTARIVPYLDAFPPETKSDQLESFIGRMAKEVAMGSTPDQEEAGKRYINWVRLTMGDGKIGTGGLLLVASPEGTLHYAQLLDLMELRLTHREWVKQHELRWEQEMRGQKQYAKSEKRVCDVNHDFGMER